MVKVFFHKGELVEVYPTLREASAHCKYTKGAFIRYDKERQNFVVEGNRAAKDPDRLTLPLYTMMPVEIRRRFL